MSIEITPTKIFNGANIYSKEAVCKILSKSLRSLRRYIASGKLKAEYIGTGIMDVEFTEQAIDDFRARKWAVKRRQK